ncbi:MAG: exopolysaccharide biosynthesis protein [Proteobacteria bacterium]|nr:exopolysaccharide biosynthesis protein [Pseudomonadota bacterium]
MSDGGTLLPVLERLFAGPRESRLTLDAFFAGLEMRSYAFVIAALSLPNCVPTGIPLLSTVTGVPMLLLVAQAAMGRSTPTLPRFLGARTLPRGRLQDCLARGRPHIEWLEDMVHPRREWWVRGTRRRALQAALTVMIVVLALPIPFDNLLPAWAILFFCLALLERDGVMAMLGWLFTILTALWTAFLLIVGPLVVIGLAKSLF